MVQQTKSEDTASPHDGFFAEAMLSLPEEKVVRGVTVRKMTCGGFIRSSAMLHDLPTKLASICFPGATLEVAIRRLSAADDKTLRTAFERAMIGAPSLAVRLTAVLCDLPEQRLLDDPAIGPEGLLALLLAWFELNRIGDFRRTARSLIRQLRAVSSPSLAGFGSSDSSRRA